MKHSLVLMVLLAASVTAQNTLEIIAAYYGTSDRFADVTTKVRPNVAPDGSINLRVASGTFGLSDASRNAPRVLRMYYKLNRQFQHGEWPEGEMLRIGTPAPPEPQAIQKPRIRIVQAAYGAGRRTIDVTQLLQNRIAATQSDRFELQVTNANMGGTDPAPAVVKALALTYEMGGKTVQAMVPENDWLRIPDSSTTADVVATGLHIVQGTYGTDARNADVTNVLRSLVSDNKLALTVGVNTLAVDPARGDEKVLYVVYTWDGQRYETRVADGRTLDLPGRNPASGPKPPPSLFGATADGVCLHPELEFRGTPFCVAVGQNAATLPAFSKYASLRLRGKIRSVELFELPGFKGRSVRLDSSQTDLAPYASGQNSWVIRPGSLKLN